MTAASLAVVSLGFKERVAHVTIDKDTLIRQEGARSYFEKRGMYCNPYPANTPEHNYFEGGWSQALRKDDARLVNATQRVEPLAVKSVAPASRNLYAEIKGRSRSR